MSKPLLIHIPEPRLTFGFDQKLCDPRDGLTLFGPYTRKQISGQVNVGIIGPDQQRKNVRRYLLNLHKPIFGPGKEIARPYFPGLEATYGIYINFENLKELDVPKTEIDRYLKYTDGHQRVHHLTNLFSEKLCGYMREEEVPITVWFVAIPDEIYLYGRPNSKIPSALDNVRLGLQKKHRATPPESFLFEDMAKQQAELQQAYEFEVNFHHQLKAKLLEYQIITQIIRESKIAYQDMWDNQKKIDYEKKFDTSKAWNIATALYYKVGGLPWRLGDIREKVCYLGLVYKKTDLQEDTTNACCAAQMFLDSGDGMVFRGNIGPWYNPETREFHLKKQDAAELLGQSLVAFKAKSETNQYPEEIFIHGRTKFNDEEWSGFTEAADGKSHVIGIRIRDDRTFKLYRDGTYCVPRGSTLKINSQRAFLWTRGYIPRLQTQLGLETPNPLSVEIDRGSADLQLVCKDILALTKLNYNSCIYADGLPVTLRFADSIGDVLTAGKNIQTKVLTFKHYI